MTAVTDDLISAALDYLKLGLRVIALTGKAPNGQVHSHGLKDAFVPHSNWSMVEHAFRHPDTTGIGILTGRPYYVVDIDGEEGAAAWKALAGDDWMPDRWVAKTGRGLHLWVASYETWPTTKLAEKLDFKGEGGYVAAPPSRHPDGHMYEWLLSPDDEDHPLEMPFALHDVLVARSFDRERATVSRDIVRLQRHVYDAAEGKFFANQTNYDGIIDRVRAEPEGNRNSVLYWAARTMLDEGAVQEDIEELFDAAVTSGLTRVESRRTIRSAFDA